MVFICGGCYFCFQSSLFWDLFLCANYDENRIPSPNGKYQAVTFTKDCGGAASAFTPYVSILYPNEKLHEYQEGNIFVGSKGESFIKAKWITDTHLVIWYTVNQNLLPTLMVNNKYGIAIEYRKFKIAAIRQRRPTLRAPDWWGRTAQIGLHLASSWFRQSGVISSHPPAGNANRWASNIFNRET